MILILRFSFFYLFEETEARASGASNSIARLSLSEDAEEPESVFSTSIFRAQI